MLGNGRVCAAPPLTVMVVGRLAGVPLAQPKVSVALPAVGALTVHVMVEPTALVTLQNPVPEKPAWLLSMVPWQVPFSASYRVTPGVPDPGTGGSGACTQFSRAL